MALGSVAIAVGFPLLPVGRWFNFVSPPPLFFVFLVGAAAAYLGLVEITKGFFYRFSRDATPCQLNSHSGASYVRLKAVLRQIFEGVAGAR